MVLSFEVGHRELGNRMHRMRTRTIWISLLCGAVLIPACLPGDERANVRQPKFAKLIEQLGANKFKTRQAAEQQLIKLGTAAIGPLRAASSHKSPEVRGRARQLVAKLHFAPIHRRMLAIAQLPDGKINLEECMYLISRLVDHTVEKKKIDQKLDELATRIKKKLGEKVDPAKADPKKVLAAIHQVMFVEDKFDGDHSETYDHPKNSSISYVLEKRKGLPIILSHIMVAVGERLNFPLVGSPVPGRYMVKYDAQRAPAEFPSQDLIINPFDGGEQMTMAQYQAKMMVAPIYGGGNRSIVNRMLRNLESDCQVVSDLERAKHAARLLPMFEGTIR